MLFLTYLSIKAGLSLSSHCSTHSTLRRDSASLYELELDSPTLFGIACVILPLHYCGLCIFWLSLIKYDCKLDKNKWIASLGLTTPSVTNKLGSLNNWSFEPDLFVKLVDLLLYLQQETHL